NELLEGGKHGLVSEPLVTRRLRNAEINHLRHRHAVMPRDQNVRWLDVAMNDSLLMRVLDRVANLREQFEPLLGSEIILVAVVGDFDPPHQFHYEEGPARLRRTRIEHLRDIRMIHERERLPLRLEARNHTLRIHAKLDDLE